MSFTHFTLAYLLGEVIRTDNSSVFNGEMAFMFISKRISSVCTLLELEGIFGREHTQLSRLFDYFVERLYGQYSWLIVNNMNYFVDRFHMYNTKILSRVILPTPQGAQRVVSFTDCHVSQICRPEGNEDLQNSVYNGMNRVHALKFTATGGPDGVLQNLGVVASRRNDRIGLRNSGINMKLMNTQNAGGIPALQQGITYTDKGFDNLSQVCAAFHGRNVLVWQHIESIKMMRPRGVGIETPFCKILQNSKTVGWLKGRKIQLSSVAKVFYLAVIFCNVHTCTYGSEVSEYFDCLPPTVSSYIRCPAAGIVINI